MKRQNGFSLIELMVAIAITVTIVGGAMSALYQAQKSTQIVASQANTQDNLRAGMHFIVRDLTQAGEGIPQGGISIPNNGIVSNINRPGTAITFPTNYVALPPIVPGSQIGQLATSVNPSTNAVLTGIATDVINVMYADNTLVDGTALQHATNTYPVFQANPPGPACNGVISPTGAFVTLDANCFTMPGAAQPISVGNLIMFHNANGTALEYVTGVNGQTINFAGGDPAGLNQTGKASGTVSNLQNAGGGFPPTTVTRVWMVSYYIDTATNPAKPQLIRQVNYPNYPAGNAAANPPTVVADVIENLGFSYNITASVDPVGTYPLGAGNAPTPILPDTPTQIRAVNVFLAGRSEYTYSYGKTPQYMRNNLTTQVCPRSLSFTNLFQTTASQTAP